MLFCGTGPISRRITGTRRIGRVICLGAPENGVGMTISSRRGPAGPILRLDLRALSSKLEGGSLGEPD